MTESIASFGVLEVLSRSGKVIQRAELDQNTLSIGRSYENDIILDDHYVCPEHLSVIKEGDGLLVEDLNSVNGLFQNKFHINGDRLKVSPNETFRIGHTTLRYRLSDMPITATKVDRHAQNSFWSLQNPWLICLITLIFIGFSGVEAFFAQMEETDNLKLLSELLSGLFVVLSWAGLWALFGKLIVDRASFLTHFGIFSLANILFSLISIILGYLFYAFGFDSALSTVSMLLTACVSIWLLYTHLGYSTKMTRRSMLTFSAVLTFLGIGFYFLQMQVLQSEFNYMPSYDVILKSPDFNFVSGESVDNFFTATDTLKEQLREEINQQ